MPLTSLSPHEALQHLRGFSDWEAFVDEIEEVRMRVDLKQHGKYWKHQLKDTS